MATLVTLKRNKEFGYVYRRGKSVPRHDFTMIYVKSRYGGVRAGFVVSRKVGNSVVRNRARRRMKEALRGILPQVTGNYSVIFVAKPRISDAVFSDLRAQMLQAFTKAGILPPVDGGKQK